MTQQQNTATDRKAEKREEKEQAPEASAATQEAAHAQGRGQCGPQKRNPKTGECE